MNTPQETPRENNSSPTSNDSGTLPELRDQDLPEAPALSGLVAMEDPASRDLVRAVVLKVAYLMEPDMDAGRFKALIQYISDQDWTSAELVHAAERLPRDERLDEKIRYGGRLTPADFERVIEGAKEIAETINGPLSTEQMERAVELEPELRRTDFRRQRGDVPEENRWILESEPLERVFGMDRSRR